MPPPRDAVTVMLLPSCTDDWLGESVKLFGGTGVAVCVAVGVGVGVGVLVGVWVGVFVGVWVGVWVGVFVGV